MSKNVASQEVCDHEGQWQNYPANICGDKPYEVLDVPHGIRCRRCGAEIPKDAIAAVLLDDRD